MEDTDMGNDIIVPSTQTIDLSRARPFDPKTLPLLGPGWTV